MDPRFEKAPPSIARALVLVAAVIPQVILTLAWYVAVGAAVGVWMALEDLVRE